MFKKVMVVLMVALGFAANTHAADKPPNIVLIISDDQSWTDYSFMGHEAVKTPNLDELSTQGATFRCGYVPTALCRPALMTLATGLYAHRNLITGNGPAKKPRRTRNIPPILERIRKSY